MSLLICLTVNRALLDALEQALGDEYRVRVIDDPAGLAACMASPDDNDNASAALLIEDAALAHFGQECCAELISQARARSMAVIMLDDDAVQPQRSKAMALGFDDYLCQPFHKPVLDGKLKTHFRLQSLERRIHSQKDEMEKMGAELALVQDAAILCLAAVARVRDHSTGNPCAAYPALRQGAGRASASSSAFFRRARQ